MSDFDFSAWEVTDDLPRHTPGIHVRVGMVTTLDGYIALNGSSRGIGGEADHAAIVALRSNTDVVVNTAFTVAQERLRPARQARHVVLTGSDRLTTDLPLFGPGVERVLIVAGSQVSASRIGAWREAGAQVHQINEPRVRADWLIPWLRDEQHAKTVLCEGGPSLNAQMSDAGVVDEWCLTLSLKLMAESAVKQTTVNRISNPLKTGKSLNLRHLLVTKTELVGIYSTHPLSDPIPQVHTA
ncbi:dihydrofolate reductase family protein [Stomatohabitans albus]|uniref:dihydrofolate reductase family protein n=1 Tax=Stomatohabitans albus TaxID=3110766 RepID=UPI00300CB354